MVASDRLDDEVAFSWCLIHFKDKEYSTQEFGEFCDKIQRAYVFDVVALRERMLFRDNFADVLVSDKKTCTRERLLETLSAVGDLHIGFEGEGGQMGYGMSTGYAGTGLRHPSMPLHNMPASHRRIVLKHLEAKGLISIKDKDDDAWSGLAITRFGEQVLDTYNRCGDCGTRKHWYNTHRYTQTDVNSGYSSTGRICLCECEKKKYLKDSNESVMTNHRFGLGKKITGNEVNEK